MNEPVPPELPLSNQPKSTHGGTQGSSCICSRGWPCWTSMSREAFGLVKVNCPSVGKCQGREEIGWLVSKGRVMG